MILTKTLLPPDFMKRARQTERIDFTDLPYGPVLEQVLSSIFVSLALLSQRRTKAAIRFDVRHKNINQNFSFLKSEVALGRDRHLVDHYEDLAGLRSRSKSARAGSTRISSLILNWFDRINNLDRWRITSPSKIPKRHGLPVAFLPSPLAILYDFLTDPDDPSTRAFSLVAVRNVLLRSLKIVPSGSGVPPDGWVTMTPEDVARALSTVATFRVGRDNIPAGIKNPIDSFVRHFLAMKGVLHLRFGSTKNAPSNGLEDRIRYCDGGSILGQNDLYEFRPDPDLDHLPELPEIVNEIWGGPIPIRGADTIFFGGMRFSEAGGLVIGISGGPGTGKTSLGLSLLGRLAPLKTRALYITAEEEPEDLYSRLSSIVPDNIKRLSFAPSYDRESTRREKWLVFRSCRRPGQTNSKLDSSVLQEFIEELTALKQELPRQVSETSPRPHPFRLMIVLDSLHSFYPEKLTEDEPQDEQYSLEQFVTDCRTLEAVVVLTFAEEWWGIKRIEYLVDTAIHLDYEKTTVRGRKPARLLILTKTRQQISRPGAHGFHLSGEQGFRIAPQIPSQLDKRSIFQSILPNSLRGVDVFRRPTFVDQAAEISLDIAKPVRQFDSNFVEGQLKIAENSHVLIHGKGSGGKAGLALKIALSPLITYGSKGFDEQASPESQKVLVISFLYAEQYYLNLLGRIANLARFEYSKDQQASGNPRLYVLSLYPVLYSTRRFV